MLNSHQREKLQQQQWHVLYNILRSFFPKHVLYVNKKRPSLIRSNKAPTNTLPVSNCGLGKASSSIGMRSTHKCLVRAGDEISTHRSDLLRCWMQNGRARAPWSVRWIRGWRSRPSSRVWCLGCTSLSRTLSLSWRACYALASFPHSSPRARRRLLMLSRSAITSSHQKRCSWRCTEDAVISPGSSWVVSLRNGECWQQRPPPCAPSPSGRSCHPSADRLTRRSLRQPRREREHASPVVGIE